MFVSPFIRKIPLAIVSEYFVNTPHMTITKNAEFILIIKQGLKYFIE